MTRVYVGNLEDGCSKRELEREMEGFGRLRDVWVARNPPGFAFVVFEDRRDAEDAVRHLNGRRLCGCRVRVEVARGPSRGGRAARLGLTEKCYECGRVGHYARDCTRRPGSYRSERSRSQSPKRRHSRSRSYSPRKRKSRSASRSRSESKEKKGRKSRDSRSRSGSKEPKSDSEEKATRRRSSEKNDDDDDSEKEQSKRSGDEAEDDGKASDENEDDIASKENDTKVDDKSE